jgi:hypothetical protein
MSVSAGEANTPPSSSNNLPPDVSTMIGLPATARFSSECVTVSNAEGRKPTVIKGMLLTIAMPASGR